MQRNTHPLTRRSYQLLTVMLIIAALQLSGCGRKASESSATAEAEQPARIEKVDGSDLSRIILTADAAERLDIQTAAVQDVDYEGEQHTTIPYSAVVIDVDGNTWTYTSPEPLTFIRHSVDIDSIDGDLAILTEGPPSGTPVVTVGVQELFGAEFEFSVE
jgi:hypothetical protein